MQWSPVKIYVNNKKNNKCLPCFPTDISLLHSRIYIFKQKGGGKEGGSNLIKSADDPPHSDVFNANLDLVGNLNPGVILLAAISSLL